MRVPSSPRARHCVLVAAALAAGCGGAQPEPDVLRLVSFRQQDEVGVFLNEPLVLHFDRELERTSITPESLQVVGPEGERARGRLEIQGNKVLFVPVLPHRNDLTDAGLLPGALYTVIALGFPNLDGLRARNGGAPLASTCVGRFETITPVDPPQGGFGGPLFVDDTPDRAAPLRLLASELGPVDPIRLVCAEPVDPRTVLSEDFELWRAETAPAGEDESVALEAIPVRAVLRDNTEEGAVVELRPVDLEGNLRGLTVGEYQLWVRPETFRLRDLGGHGVVPVWVHEPRAGLFRVRMPEEGAGIGSLTEEFLDQRTRSPAAVDGVAGTAHWADGVVTVRYPAAVGTGVDGVVALDGKEPRGDVEAVELSVPASADARLTGRGLVTLRSQGRLVVDGVLRRDVEGVQLESEELGHASFAAWHQWLHGDANVAWSVPGMTFEDGETLSEWVARARTADEPWTVLVAGGDLVVNGTLWTDGPVLLVAGGWIRVSGEVRSRPLEHWVLGHGGSSPRNKPRPAPLELDPPRTNPLVVPQTFSVLSAPIRPPRGLMRWLPSRVRADARAGDVRVSYLGEPDVPAGLLGPVDSPVLLEDCEVIRLRIDLTLPAAEATSVFAPPIVDAVELSWDETEVVR